MDSSMIVAIMARDVGRQFFTFSIGVAEQDFNELPFARMVAEHFGTQHVEQVVGSDLLHLLPRMVWHLDEPSDPIAACQQHAGALAAQHVKVVLGGDGGDELFGGFDRYRGLGLVTRYARIPAAVRAHAIAPLLARLPESFAYKNLPQQLRWMHQVAQQATIGRRYAEATCFFRFNHGAKEGLFTPEAWAQVGQSDSADIIAAAYERAEADNPLDRKLYADLMTRLPEHSLMLADRMTMAHGLELRSPFLDHELVELMASYPGNMKIRGGELKYILRRLAADYLPEPVARRSKHGFMFPIAYWLRDELHPLAERFLLDSQLVQQGLFRETAIRRLLDEHRQGRADHHVRLWMLMNVEVWHQMYIQQASIESVGDQLIGQHMPVAG